MFIEANETKREGGREGGGGEAGRQAASSSSFQMRMKGYEGRVKTLVHSKGTICW